MTDSDKQKAADAIKTLHRISQEYQIDMEIHILPDYTCVELIGDDRRHYSMITPGKDDEKQLFNTSLMTKE